MNLDDRRMRYGVKWRLHQVKKGGDTSPMNTHLELGLEKITKKPEQDKKFRLEAHIRLAQAAELPQ